MVGFCDDPAGGCYSYFHIAVVDCNGHDRARWQGPYNRIGNSEAYNQTRTWPDQPHLENLFNTFRKNDTVRLLPITFYPSWENIVYSAKITVSFEVERSHTVLSPQIGLYSGTQDVYRSLSSATQEFRLLKLLSDAPGSLIKCTLVPTHSTHLERPQFDAISYCWGDVNGTVPIQVNGQELLVTSNLHKLLQRIRNDDGTVRMLWIDALCINQSDLKERAQQVQMMRLIYAQANRVVIWLGEHTTIFRTILSQPSANSWNWTQTSSMQS
jgi:hypothetical protein